MAKLIHIQTCPRGSRSASQAVAACFVESYRAAHPGDTVETLDLWHAELPELDGSTIDARYAIAHGLHERLSLRREDVFIGLVEVSKENWSFGKGEAQYAK